MEMEMTSQAQYKQYLKQKMESGSDSGFPLFADFVRSVVHASKSGRWDARLGRLSESKAMAEGTGAGGGFIVPEAHAARLLFMALEKSVVYNKCTILPFSTSDRLVIPAVDEVSHASSIWGGIQF